ncbi:hypothetical protein [Legionella quateirensis]|uniref:Uncharacterized protein involved in outer membrane biogenesis n=1 Tax=Legionella quateirensis TaxID=45072 RepID=A0A378KP81_9GAMM|nr:hypothetical protein [Legionella quateirensis]KTD52878.1 hypothetical protein Lqua_0711 [Legionella quateirensis]STY16392.1 Uncharacterized protein involved in outer membrane biogenesis [Legionella quateirensis]
MTDTQSSKGKIILILISIVVFLIFLINYILTYLANLFIANTIVPQFNNQKGAVTFYAHVRLFPSIKLSINNFEFNQNNKSIIKIDEVSVKISFWQLFNKKLHISKLSINDGFINLYNIPQIKWKENTKTAEPEEKKPEPRKEIITTQETTTQEASFFSLDKIELTNLQINYSPSQTSQPIYLNSIQYDNSLTNNSEHVVTISGSWWDEPINATVTLKLNSSYPMLMAHINFARNELFLTTNTIANSFQMQTHIAIKNPEIIAQLISIPKMHLPTQINATLNAEKHQLSIAPIQIVFPTATLHATITLAGESPINMQMTLPNDLLTDLSGNMIYEACPLPQVMTMLLKGINTEVTITTPQSSIIGMEKTLIKIDGLGIQFEGNSLPSALKKNMQTCFDYNLPDASKVMDTLLGPPS